MVLFSYCSTHTRAGAYFLRGGGNLSKKIILELLKGVKDAQNNKKFIHTTFHFNLWSPPPPPRTSVAQPTYLISIFRRAMKSQCSEFSTKKQKESHIE